MLVHFWLWWIILLKFHLQVFILIPVIMLLISIYLVVAPIIENPQIGLLYAFLITIGGLIFYFPFVYFKWYPPYMGEYDLPFINILDNTTFHWVVIVTLIHDDIDISI